MKKYVFVLLLSFFICITGVIQVFANVTNFRGYWVKFWYSVEIPENEDFFYVIYNIEYNQIYLDFSRSSKINIMKDYEYIHHSIDLSSALE